VFLLCPLMRIRGAFRYFWPRSGAGAETFGNVAVNLKTKSAGDGYPKKAIEKRFYAFLARARFHTAWVETGHSPQISAQAE
jgi:hypothetical protein